MEQNIKLMNPIAFVSESQLEKFLDSTKTMQRGFAYEWEGEHVVHLSTTPWTHAYGQQYEVSFYNGKVSECQPDTYVVEVTRTDNAVKANVYYIHTDGTKQVADVNYIPKIDDLYSRSKGLLEINILADKIVAIFGLGSFGSQIAIELAKAGVGHFSLFDHDRIELHNLARNTATVKDLGRLKTDVIEEAIKGKNPYAEVKKFPIDINDHLEILKEEISKAHIVICATDNNKSRFNISPILVEEQKIGIFGRAVTRAEGGDVFIQRPGGPCYCCLIGDQWFIQAQEEITNANSARRNGQIAAYVSEEDAEAVVQVGLSTDIEPICNMMVKLALMELSRGTQSGISCLEDELVWNYYMWANRRERRHKNWAPMPGTVNKPTILRWYGAHISRNENCCLCSAHNMKLDEGEDVLDSYDIDIEDNDLTDITIE